MATPEDTPLLLDVMLGKLARLLRMCGYDAAYALDRGVEDDARLREIANREGRVLLTRDEELARRTPESVLLRTRHVDDQLRELADAGFELSLPEEPRRCATCNGTLTDAATPHPEHVPDDAERVWACTECGQHYWKGSHWEDVETRLEEV
ncbi:Mut7-C RNAse domain-containing protein [Halarchaeum sp. P4]|uniref:Mut7-C RNAse domain-containing protein n=1 Tax=Halarchaeum sp. P4 TaxID=3421639 RepID=UPI003EBD9B86